jgi:hypothetical protein
MKDKLNKVIIFLCAFLMLLIPALCIADAGHHSSYSSGGSHHSSSGRSHHSSGSSYRSSSSRSSSSSSSSDDPSGAEVFIIVSVVIILIVIIVIFGNINNNKGPNFYYVQLMDQERIDKIDPSIKINETMDYVFDLFVKEQTAWMNFDYEGLRAILSDELFNVYKMQLETMEAGMEKNIMEDIVKVDGGIVAVRKHEYTEELIVKLHVRMKDYIINTVTNKPKHGSPDKIMDNNYIITLEKSIRSEITNCPNCGGELNDNASQKCPYCDAVLVKGSKDFVIVKQENVQGKYF